LFVIQLEFNRVFLFSSGEVPSPATKHQIERLSSYLEIQMAKGSGGRKLDLQCRLGDLELNNSEFKRCKSSATKLTQQHSKNVLINHSMMLFLEETIGFQVDSNNMLSLDVHGKHSGDYEHIYFPSPKLDVKSTIATK
jgi:hypothetical protein